MEDVCRYDSKTDALCFRIISTYIFEYMIFARYKKNMEDGER